MTKSLTIPTKPQRARIAWIDLLEAIAIFFVVLYHTMTYKTNFLTQDSSSMSYIYYFFNTILSTCVPLFFFANGYLLFSKNLNLKKHIKKILKLILVMIVWGSITTLILKIKYNIPMSAKEFFDIVWYTKQGWTEYLWFIGTLVCIYIFFPLLKTAYDYNKKSSFILRSS